jgi:tRNA A-37 threonylcarbamoyl transferase component Bud32
MDTRSIPERDTLLNRSRIQNRRFLWFARGLWLLLVGGALLYFLTSLPNGFIIFRDDPRWGGGYAEVLASLQISPSAFAAFLIFLEVFVFIPSFIYTFLVLSQRSDDWMALLVTATTFLIPISSSFSVYQNNNPAGGWVFGVATMAIFTTLLVFPDGRFVPHWSRYLLLFSTPIFLLSGFLFSGMMRGEGLEGWQAIVILTAETFAFFFGIGAQIYRYRRVATPLQRQQSKWLILGMLVFMTTIYVFVATQFFPALRVPSVSQEVIYSPISLAMVFIFVPLLQITLSLIPISMGAAVVRYRLWQIDVVLNRSVVYTLQTVMLIFLFGGLFFLLQFLLAFVFGSSQDALAIGISAAVVAAAFNPVRMRARRLVDRYLFGLRFDLNELKRVQQRRDISHAGALSGQKIAGYEIMDLIGKGGMGEVYRGEANGRVIAMKTMLFELAQNPEMRQRFYNEAELGMHLEHKNIVKVYTTGDFEGTPYLIMDYVEGNDLRDILSEAERMEEEEAIKILKQVADALDLAHAEGYVHRDLKSANIMLEPSGRAVLMDFGVSKIEGKTSGLTGTGAIGTIDYMAPEQIMAAREVDHRADIYSLGVVAYEMLTGEKPFTGGAAQVMFAHLQQPAPDPRDVNDEISRHAAKAIMKALEKNPDDRFASAGSFVAEMRKK